MRVLIVSEELPKDVNFGEERIVLSVIDSKKFKGRGIIEKRKSIRLNGENHFVTLGNPVEEVAKYSIALNVDFVVLQDVNLGLKVALNTPKPILILKGRDPFKSGLICYTPVLFNPIIKKKIESLPFEELYLLHVLEPIVPHGAKVNSKAQDVKNFLKNVEMKLEKVKGVHIRLGDPSNEILKTAEELKVTCVVLSTDIKGKGLGKTTEKVAKESKSSVLIWKDLIKRNGFIQNV